MPKISVLLPAYNCERYIVETLESLRHQTYKDFEVLIINDGSTDQTEKLVQDYITDHGDIDIRIIRNEKNSGISFSLNHGIRKASGQFIARMDSDDICLPDRFESQLKFLEENEDIDFVGTGYKTFGKGFSRKNIHPETDLEIKTALIFDSAFAHPTMMMRRDSILKNGLFYDSSFDSAEDYELWTRSAKCCNFHNLQKTLLNYRVHHQQISTSKRESQVNLAKKARLMYLKSLNINLSPESIDFHHHFSIYELENFDETTLEHARQWLVELGDEIQNKTPAWNDELKKQLTIRFTRIFYENLGNPYLRIFLVENKLLNHDLVGIRKKAFYVFRFLVKKTMKWIQLVGCQSIRDE